MRTIKVYLCVMPTNCNGVWFDPDEENFTEGWADRIKRGIEHACDDKIKVEIVNPDYTLEQCGLTTEARENVVRRKAIDFFIADITIFAYCCDRSPQAMDYFGIDADLCTASGRKKFVLCENTTVTEWTRLLNRIKELAK